jgi:hypothetical protein
MRLDPHPTQPTPLCKIKRVNPAFRSVSTPRWTKDLPVAGPVNPIRAPGTGSGTASTLEWSAERLIERLHSELGPRAWKRLVQAAERRGATVDQLLRWGLSEVA